MSILFRTYSWPILLTASAMALGAVCQTVVPLLPLTMWERGASYVYPWVDRVLPKSAPQGDAPLAIIDLDAKSLQQLGAPISAAHLENFFKRLRSDQHPYLLSIVPLGPTTPSEGGVLSLGSATGQSILDRYGRVISSGVRHYPRVGHGGGESESAVSLPPVLERPGALLRGANEPTFRNQAFLQTVHLTESQGAMAHALAVGTAPRLVAEFGPSCFENYILVTANSKTQGILPSASLWATAYGTRLRFRTELGLATWPAPNDPLPFQFEQSRDLRPLSCLRDSTLDDLAYLAQHHIRIVSFADYLRSNVTPLNVPLVLLVQSGMKASKDSALGPLRWARLTHELMTQRVMERSFMGTRTRSAWLPILAAGIFAVAGLFLSPLRFTLLVLSALGLTVLGSLVWMYVVHAFVLPLQLMAWLLAMSAFATIMTAMMALASRARYRRLAEALRQRLDSSTSPHEIAISATGVLRTIIPKSDVKLQHRPGPGPRVGHPRSDGPRSLIPSTVYLRLADARGNAAWVGMSRQIQCHLLLEVEGQNFGAMIVSALFPGWREGYDRAAITALQDEIARALRNRESADQVVTTQPDRPRSHPVKSTVPPTTGTPAPSEQHATDDLSRVPPTLLEMNLAALYRDSGSSDALPTELAHMLRLQIGRQGSVLILGERLVVILDRLDSTHDRTHVDLAIDLHRLTVARVVEIQGSAAALPPGIPGAVHVLDPSLPIDRSDGDERSTILATSEANMPERMIDLCRHPNLKPVLGSSPLILSPAAVDHLAQHRSVPRSALMLREYQATMRNFADVEVLMLVSSPRAA